MRELNAGGHKLRRPSFSNTLSELPEVEEPVATDEPPCTTLDLTSFHVLPPIGDDDTLPSPRPRYNTMPEDNAKRLRGKIATARVMKINGDLQLARTGYANRQDFSEKIQQYKSENPAATAHRRHSLAVPQMRRSSDGFTTPHAIFDLCKHFNVSSKMYNNHSKSTESVDRISSVTDVASHDQSNDDQNKNLDVQQWGDAFDDSESDSPYGSYDNLSSSLTHSGHIPRRRLRMTRRWSNPEFAKTSRKVNLLIKYGRVLRGKYCNRTDTDKTPQPKTIRTLADFMIEMPKKPRFSSYMSPEAQYSLMKGYEDKLYQRLCDCVPDKKVVLKRNKTPCQRVSIKSKNTLGFLDDSDEDEEDETCDDDNTTTEKEANKDMDTFLTQSGSGNSDCKIRKPSLDSTSPESLGTVIKADSVNTQADTQTDPDSKTVLRSLRRVSISLERGGSINKHFHDEDEDEEDICSTFSSRPRAYSLPNMSNTISFDRRLMMSYRLQNAMDILDNIRSEDETKLSPRLKVKRTTNLAEYNTWVSEWKKEFLVRNGYG